MNSRLMFRPDLNECILEERALLAIANFGIVILTTNGLSLVTPFPGANSSGAASGPTATSSAGVSGTPIPTSLYVTGTGGISSLKPGNITGVPSLAGGAGAAGAFSATIQIGSGADTADGPTLNISNGGATNNVVGVFSVADPTAGLRSRRSVAQRPPRTRPCFLRGQSYRDTAPVAPPAPMGVMTQSATGMNSSNSNASSGPNPQLRSG